MIEIESLQKVVDRKTAVDIETLCVKAGEIAVLVGPVDSGKDTLFKLLTGRFRPTAGEVRLAGVDPFVEKEPFILSILADGERANPVDALRRE
ncbi:MAG: ATP-binding cassette domain-containing protein [Rhodothermales bacterium]